FASVAAASRIRAGRYRVAGIDIRTDTAAVPSPVNQSRSSPLHLGRHARAATRARLRLAMALGPLSLLAQLPAQVSWNLLTTNVRPSVRWEHAMAYASARRRTVLFGGYDSTSFLADTWQFDGASWAQASASGPAGCSSHAMAYDTARGRVVLFG